MIMIVRQNRKHHSGDVGARRYIYHVPFEVSRALIVTCDPWDEHRQGGNGTDDLDYNVFDSGFFRLADDVEASFLCGLGM